MSFTPFFTSYSASTVHEPGSTKTIGQKKWIERILMGGKHKISKSYLGSPRKNIYIFDLYSYICYTSGIISVDREAQRVF